MLVNSAYAEHYNGNKVQYSRRQQLTLMHAQLILHAPPRWDSRDYF